MGLIHARNGWTLLYKRDGIQQSRSLHTHDRTEAERRAFTPRPVHGAHQMKTLAQEVFEGVDDSILDKRAGEWLLARGFRNQSEIGTLKLRNMANRDEAIPFAPYHDPTGFALLRLCMPYPPEVLQSFRRRTNRTYNIRHSLTDCPNRAAWFDARAD